MTKKQEIKLFEDKKVRTVWDDEKEKWFFCVVDVVEALTDSKDPKDYIKKMKKRDQELSKGWGQIVTPLSVQTAGGKQRVNCAPRDGIFRRIIGTGLSRRFIMKKNERILCGSLVFSYLWLCCARHPEG